MKKILLIALGTLLCVGVQAKGDAKKELKSSFATSTAPTLNVEIQFASIEIASWSNPSVEVRAEIEVEAENESRAQQMLNCIDVKIVQNGNLVNIATHVNEDAMKAAVGKKGNRNYEIKIYVKAPVSTMIDANTQYGNVKLDKIDGVVKSKVQFGNFTADALGANSKLNIQYGNVKIGTASDLALNIQFGNSAIDRAANLTMSSAYGSHKFGSVQSITTKSQFDKYELTSAGSVTFNSCQYTNVKIGDLTQAANLGKVSFGSVTIANVSAEFTKVNISGNFTDIKVGFAAAAAFSADLRNVFGAINADALHGVISDMVAGYDKTSFTIEVGGSSTKKVFISNSQASIKLTKNN